ncbi:hypothetical protein [Flavivirga eckloniae]|nr:hypothetical protein [Flavivirga eckloniae]
MFVEEKLSYIYKISLVLFFLVLTRGQFIAVVPVLVLTVGYLIFKDKSFAKNYKYLIILVALPFITSLTEKVYNKIVFGHFVNNAMNYVHLISSPFYIANEDDINLFDEENEKTYFKLIYDSLYEAELTHDQNFSIETDDYKFYEHNFTKICNKRVYKLGLEFFEEKGLDYYEQNIALNKLCSKMVFPLIKQNLKTWCILFFKNLKNAFGSFKGLLMFLVLLGYGIFFLIKNNSTIYKFIVLAILFMLANNALIALAVHSIKRYIFYFDWVIFVVLILFLNEILKNKRIDEC